MSTSVVTIPLDMTMADIAQFLIDNHISGVPVVAPDGRFVGIVSQGDLLQLAGLRGEMQRSWWLRLMSSLEQNVKDLVK